MFGFLEGLVHTEAGDNGVHRSTHIAGEHGSSTRMEVDAGVLALLIRKDSFIGSDSKSMVDKAAWLINEANAADERAEAQYFRPTKTP